MASRRDSRGSKRAATQDPTGQPAAKKIPHGVQKSTLKAVADILEHPMAHGIPENARQMLAAALSDSICVPVDERHPHQARMVDMIGEVVAEVVSKMKASIDAAAAHVVEMDKSRPELDRKKTEAEAKLAAVSADVDAKMIASSNASAQVAEAKEALKEKQHALKTVEAPLKPSREEKESLETMLSTDFKALRDPAEWEAGNVKKCSSAIVSLAKKSAFEDLLISSLSISLSRQPNERTQFDGLVLQQFEEAALEKVKHLVATLEGGAASTAECMSAAEAAQSDLEKRKEVSETAAAALQAAQNEHREVSAHLQVTTRAIGNYWPEMEKACAEPDKRKEELQNFQDWNVFCFEALKERLSAKRSKELADAEAAKAAEAAAIAEAEALKERVAAKAAEAEQAAKAAQAQQAAQAAEVVHAD